MTNDAAALLLHSGKKSGHIDTGEERNVESVAEPDEPGRFIGGIDVEHAGQHAGLIGHNAHRASLQAAKADDDVGGKSGLNLEEVLIVDDALHDFPGVIWNFRVDGQNRVHV